MDWALYSELKQCSGPLPELLLDLNRYCLRASYGSQDEREAHAKRLLTFLPDREAATRLLAAFSKTSWPGSFGQSPYGEVMSVVRSAVAGLPLVSQGSEGERELHGLLLEAYAPAGAVARWRLDRGQLKQRYPRLLRAMRHAALLTEGEAEGALWLLLRRHPSSRSSCPSGSEALAHFGGPLKAVAAARRWRRRFASTRRVAHV